MKCKRCKKEMQSIAQHAVHLVTTHGIPKEIFYKIIEVNEAQTDLKNRLVSSHGRRNSSKMAKRK